MHTRYPCSLVSSLKAPSISVTVSRLCRKIGYLPSPARASRHAFDMLPLPKIGAALFAFFDTEAAHSQTEAERGFQPFTVATEPLTDAHLCLALASTEAPGTQAIGTGIVPADHVPVLAGTGWSCPTHRGTVRSLPIIEVEIEQARGLRHEFALLPSATQIRLRVPLQKLNHYAATTDLPVQAAVDLRTALEAFYLDDNVNGELAKRLALRAALFAAQATLQVGNAPDRDKARIQLGIGSGSQRTFPGKGTDRTQHA